MTNWQRGIQIGAGLIAVILSGLVLFFITGSVALRLTNESETVEWSLLIAPWLMLAVAAWAVWKWFSIRLVVTISALCGIFILYLVWDDSERPPAPQIGAVVPPNSKSYEAYRWLVKDDPLNRLAETSKDLADFPSDYAKWPEYVAAHRDEIVRAWEGDKLGHEWVNAMALPKPQGIFPMPKDIKEPLLSFQAIRTSSRIRWAFAQLLITDKKYDEAAKILIPLLQANYHLQWAGAGLHTEMSTLVVLRSTYKQLDALIATNGLSPAMRIQLLHVLQGATPVSAIFDQCLLGEQINVRINGTSVNGRFSETVKLYSSFDPVKISYSPYLWRLFYNPNRSERGYLDYLNESFRLASQRQLDAMETLLQNNSRPANPWRIKNQSGSLPAEIVGSFFGKIAKGFWEMEDLRLALLKKLETP
jgi:hypothetical protein